MRRQESRWAAPLGALLVACSGCKVNIVPPPAYPDVAMNKQPSATIRPAPFRFKGLFSRAVFDWSGNDSIEVTSIRGSVVEGLGLYRANIAFTASLPDFALRCETEPSGPSVPSTRFGCWSADRGVEDLSFWMAPQADCPARDAGHARTLTTPACWRGVFRSGDFEARLFHGHVKETGAPVSWVSWLGAKGELLLAANSEVTQFDTRTRVNLFDGSASVPKETMRKLVLTTFAVAYWRDESYPD